MRCFNMVALRSPVLVVFAALAAFAGSVAATFAFDDRAVFSDPVLGSASGWWRVFGPLQTRPLTWLTFWANLRISDSPALWHAVDLFLHAAAAWLVWDVLRRLLPERAALIAAVLFAIHPIQSEAVIYVFARATLLATVLSLLAVRAWIRERAWVAVLWMGAALLAKEEVAALPVFLILLELSLRHKFKVLRFPLATMMVMSAAAGLRVIYVTARTPGAGAGTSAGVTPLEYLAAQGLAITRYLRLFLAPWGFTIDPGVPLAGSAWGWMAWAVLAAACWVAARRFYGAAAGFWFIGALALLSPSSSIFPAADFAADRRMYLPMFALAAATGLLLQNLSPKVLVAVAALLILLSEGRTRVWRSEESLWTEAVERAPQKIRPRLQLALVSRPAFALPLLLETKEIAPDDPRVASALGKLYLENANAAAALGEFGRALALEPANAKARSNRGVALAALGQTEAAREDFRQALKRDPCLLDARLNLKRLGDATQPPPGCRYTYEQRELLR